MTKIFTQVLFCFYDRVVLGPFGDFTILACCISKRKRIFVYCKMDVFFYGRIRGFWVTLWISLKVNLKKNYGKLNCVIMSSPK
ncbi:hypothetical protein GDO81_001547 [Engystomops pustulosus]|uniref:Uncharacterized protein n=1 Tax=Engystomops pustulosus TaxID=76066 RepID=A0AAV7DE61_ENGPU|nr:hypothetical protein GDO81_001547 [Engystomops pustulosus]